MRRYESADEQWAKTADLFPSNEGKRGGQWLDHRVSGFLDGILERLMLKLNEQGLIGFDLWQVDSTTIRAHKSAAEAGLKRGPKPKRENQPIMR